MENVIEGKKTIADLTDFYLEKIKLAVQESTNTNTPPSTTSRMALAFGIISNQLEMQSQRIANLEKVVIQLEEKFLKPTPHITVEDTEMDQFKALMSSANEELNSLGLKLAFQEGQAYLPG
jgi:hypothetical protein